MAAAGGRSLSAASAPPMGGSEGPAIEVGRRPAPAGEVYEVTMPKLGETVTEGTIGSWLKQVGDEVEFDDPLFEVSTDKVDSEIPSPYDGTLLEILVAAGRDGAGRHGAGPHRRAPAPRSPPAGGDARLRPLPQLRAAAAASKAPARPPGMVAAGCCRRWFAG